MNIHWHSVVTYIVGNASNPGHDMIMATVYALVAFLMLIMAFLMTHIDYVGMSKKADIGLLTFAGIFILLGIISIGATIISGIDMISQFANVTV